MSATMSKNFKSLSQFLLWFLSDAKNCKNCETDVISHGIIHCSTGRSDEKISSLSPYVILSTLTMQLNSLTWSIIQKWVRSALSVAALTAGSWRTKSLTLLSRRGVGEDDSPIRDNHESWREDINNGSGSWPRNLNEKNKRMSESSWISWKRDLIGW